MRHRLKRLNTENAKLRKIAMLQNYIAKGYELQIIERRNMEVVWCCGSVKEWN